MTAKKKPAGKWHAVLRDDGKRYVSVTAAAVSVAAAKSMVSAACRDGSMVGGHYFSYEEDGRRYACHCKICGAAFGGAAKNAVYCSQECRDEGRRRIHTSSRCRNGVGTRAGYVSKNAKVDSYLKVRDVRREWK